MRLPRSDTRTQQSPPGLRRRSTAATRSASRRGEALDCESFSPADHASRGSTMPAARSPPTASERTCADAAGRALDQRSVNPTAVCDLAPKRRRKLRPALAHERHDRDSVVVVVFAPERPRRSCPTPAPTDRCTSTSPAERLRPPYGRRRPVASNRTVTPRTCAFRQAPTAAWINLVTQSCSTRADARGPLCKMRAIGCCAAFVFALVLVAGCTGSGSDSVADRSGTAASSSSPTSSQPGHGPHATRPTLWSNGWKPGQPVFLALLFGRLHIVSTKCAYLGRPPGSPTTWPAGWHVDLHRHVLVNAAGKVVAHAGDFVASAGGSSTRKAVSRSPCGPVGRSIDFLEGSIVRVRGCTAHSLPSPRARPGHCRLPSS